MIDKDLYLQKLHDQLNEWKADIDKLKAKSSQASADAQIAMKGQIETLEGKMEEGKAKLSELSSASGEAWDVMKQGVESAWGALKSAFGEAASKFKDDAQDMAEDLSEAKDEIKEELKDEIKEELGAELKDKD
ncbi:MAG: hypothetical protein R6W97_07450 [Thiobacillus sp.]